MWRQTYQAKFAIAEFGNTVIHRNITWRLLVMRVYNFSAGPAVLPEEVLKEAAHMVNRLIY